MHRDRVFARALRQAGIAAVRLLDLGHVDLDAQARLVGNGNHPTNNFERLFCQPLPVLPDCGTPKVRPIFSISASLSGDSADEPDRSLIELLLVIRTFARFDKQAMARSVQHQFDLAEAIATRNADWAIAMMRAHIHAGRQVMLGTE